MSDTQMISREQIARESAALAEHLDRCGVQFLPLADSASVQQIAARFRTANHAGTTSPPQSAPADQPASSPPPAASGRTAAPSRAPAPRAQSDPGTPLSSVTATDSAAYPGDSLPADERRQRLDILADEVAQCTRCPALVDCRNRTVFGEGNPTPRVVFFGEGPGADEDRTGRPFVGRAGQLLTKMIEACSFRRQDVYILNTVKCRPPNNRNPVHEEIENCRQYFESQLSILRPEYIVCLGAVSAHTLLRSTLAVGQLRGVLHRYQQSKVLVTYHPAYLLRTPAAKKAAWQDLQLMLHDAGITPGGR